MDEIFGDMGEDIFSGTKIRGTTRKKIEYNPKIESPLDFFKEGNVTCRKEDEYELKRQMVEINYLYYTRRFKECVEKTDSLIKRTQHTGKSHLIELYENIARSHIALNQIEEGLEYLLLLNKKHSSPSSATLALQARCQLKLGQVRESVVSYQNCLLLVAKDDRNWFELSNILASNSSLCNNSIDLAVICALRSKKILESLLYDNKLQDSRYKERYQSSLKTVEEFLQRNEDLGKKYSNVTLSSEEIKDLLEWKEEENFLWDSRFVNLLYGEEKEDADDSEERDPSTM